MTSTLPTVYTDPSRPAANGGLDNEYADLIVSANDVLEDPAGPRYMVMGKLGNGQFGQVFRVVQVMEGVNERGPELALKITKSLIDHRRQAQSELHIMKVLQEGAVSEEELKCIVQVKGSFTLHGHMCVLMSLHAFDLYAVLGKRDWHGLPLALIQLIARQMLVALRALKRCRVVHGDIKPENVVLTDDMAMGVTLIDFGSARQEGFPCSFYMQSRYYRAPEVVLHISHGYAIDMWSLGCVLVEMFLAVPLFAGQTEIQLLDIITEFLGQFPESVVARSPRKAELFNSDGVMKSEAQICREKQIPEAKRYVYLHQNNVHDLIMLYAQGIGTTEEARRIVAAKRGHFLDLIMKMLVLSPEDRITPEEALEHPFITMDLR